MIAFDDMNKIFIVGRDGTGLRQIGPTDANAGLAESSPMGDWIAFTALGMVDGDTWIRQLFLIRPDGTGLRRLADSVKAPILYVAWSPDGQRIAFTRRIDATTQHIFTIRADGTDERQITSGSGRYVSPSYGLTPPPPEA